MPKHRHGANSSLRPKSSSVKDGFRLKSGVNQAVLHTPGIKRRSGIGRKKASSLPVPVNQDNLYTDSERQDNPEFARGDANDQEAGEYHTNRDNGLILKEITVIDQ